jgi:hypothetical protein
MSSRVRFVVVSTQRGMLDWWKCAAVSRCVTDGIQGILSASSAQGHQLVNHARHDDVEEVDDDSKRCLTTCGE